MSSLSTKVRQVINEYIKPDNTLGTMSTIHHELTGESQNFNEWQKVERLYLDMEWDAEKYRRFLRFPEIMLKKI